MSSTVEYANQLLQAEKNRAGIAALTEQNPSFSTEDAYAVQLEIIKQKTENGQTIVGKKIGLTSVAMQKLLGVDEPDYGHLLNEMVVENGGELSFGKVMQPKVEGEIAFILKEDLKGPNVTALDVVLATDYVLPALEIVDSRVKDWKIKLQDTIADNASCGQYVLGGKPVTLDQVDLSQLGMVLMKNGEIVNTGVGAAVMGHPANCVAWLANKLSEYDISLKAGEVILSGALSAAVNAEPGDTFTAKLAHLGEVSISFSS
ncbi:2-hydroxypenta-2,4-dienoate hydratase [Alkalihalophilus pseudofirmus OF4]|uniref:2-hydroxypenta-2,4-dienoate hydratase n=2 Tax=Alkalihalophilus pseudofirmus TaxID=79885 RepID=D3FWS3_ALKPO|nr:fumarylacetoacetate hydrolase family protein [Alkalihalophilus pseudofirmus]ADC50571.1 2-hydroxypenta-2,4-dienoate hydratase [Alkalihalophilus pseudofirmus OF4]MDV2883720.1 fumarylacetoacetate hydrolase family protein [Alkalihalophilus pseudofirmus]